MVQLVMPWDEPKPEPKIYPNELVDSPKLERVDIPEGRVYFTPDGPMWSVTTVLGQTSNKDYLVEWRERIGDEAADEIVRRACERGERMHDALEQRLLNNENWLFPARDHNDLEAEIMAKTIADGPLLRVKKVKATETKVWHPELMIAGTLDAFAEVYWKKGALDTVVDYKNSRKYRKPEDIVEYYCQVTLYSECAIHTLGLTATKGIIMMAMSEDYLGDKPQVFEVNVSEHLETAVGRVETHREAFGTPAAALAKALKTGTRENKEIIMKNWKEA